MKYWNKEEDVDAEGVQELGVIELDTISKIEINGGVMTFEGFQVMRQVHKTNLNKVLIVSSQSNKERNKDWCLKGEADEIEA